MKGAGMKRTTISLSDSLDHLVQREARRRAISVSELTREALRVHLGLGDGPSRTLPAFVGLGRSGYHDTAARFEEVLAAEREVDLRT